VGSAVIGWTVQWFSYLTHPDFFLFLKAAAGFDALTKTHS
jgi:hypothetical protein